MVSCDFQLCFVDFNSVLNLIVFCQYFPCIFVGFNVRVECESLVKNCEDGKVHNLLATDSRIENPRKVT